MQAGSKPTLFDFLHTKGVVIADYQFEQLIGENAFSDIAMADEGSWQP